MELTPTPKLEVGFYRPSDAFKAQPEMVAVMRADNGGLVALTGYSDFREEKIDTFIESLAEAMVYASAWDMLKLVRKIARDPDNAHSREAEDLLANLPAKMAGMFSVAECDMMDCRRQAIELIAHRARG